MQIYRDLPKCDLFSFEVVVSPKLKLLSLYDKKFEYQEFLGCHGYFGVNIERIKLVRILIDLRLDGFNCFSVPNCYEKNRLLSWPECLNFAKKYANAKGLKISEEKNPTLEIPIYHTFIIVGDNEGRAGGIVRVDRMDGHIWTMLEYEEYMYDYNGLLI